MKTSEEILKSKLPHQYQYGWFGSNPTIEWEKAIEAMEEYKNQYLSSPQEKEIVSDEIKTHCTIVCGWNEKKELVYMKTFDYENDKKQRDEAQIAVKWCIDNCKGGWRISDISVTDIVEKN